MLGEYMAQFHFPVRDGNTLLKICFYPFSFFQDLFSISVSLGKSWFLVLIVWINIIFHIFHILPQIRKIFCILAIKKMQNSARLSQLSIMTIIKAKKYMWNFSQANNQNEVRKLFLMSLKYFELIKKNIFKA